MCLLAVMNRVRQILNNNDRYKLSKYSVLLIETELPLPCSRCFSRLTYFYVVYLLVLSSLQLWLDMHRATDILRVNIANIISSSRGSVLCNIPPCNTTHSYLYSETLPVTMKSESWVAIETVSHEHMYNLKLVSL